jgi:tRNA wybutosine-synthesizing protein 1
MAKLTVPKGIKENLEKKQYGVFNHSAVQVCHWNKVSIRGKGECYKKKFYGIHTHKCLQMSPVCMWCEQNCTFCWRPMEYMQKKRITVDEVDEPEIIINELIEKRKQLLIGFKGNDAVDKEKYFDAVLPDHYAISLSGEPTMYPLLPEMIKYLKEERMAKSVFVVSNGIEPNFFARLKGDMSFCPTQLYVSLVAYDEESYIKINRPNVEDGWQRLNESLQIFKNLECRRVFRVTVIKGINSDEKSICGFAKIINEVRPDFIELKSYMHLGMSRERLSEDNMLMPEEICDFEKKLLKHLDGYNHENECKESILVLLKRDDSKFKTKILE